MEKLLILVGMLRGIYGKWLFRRLMFGVVVVAGLTIVSSILISAAIVGGLYTGFKVLLFYGVAVPYAVLICGAIFAAFTAIAVAITLNQLHRLRHTPPRLDRRGGVSGGHVIDAFLDGLLSEETYR